MYTSNDADFRQANVFDFANKLARWMSAFPLTRKPGEGDVPITINFFHTKALAVAHLLLCCCLYKGNTQFRNRILFKSVMSGGRKALQDASSDFACSRLKFLSSRLSGNRLAKEKSRVHFDAFLVASKTRMWLFLVPKADKLKNKKLTRDPKKLAIVDLGARP